MTSYSASRPPPGTSVRSGGTTTTTSKSGVTTSTTKKYVGHSDPGGSAPAATSISSGRVTPGGSAPAATSISSGQATPKYIGHSDPGGSAPAATSISSGRVTPGAVWQMGIRPSSIGKFGPGIDTKTVPFSLAQPTGTYKTTAHKEPPINTFLNIPKRITQKVHAGFQLGTGKDPDINQFPKESHQVSEYGAAGLYQLTQKKAEDYQRWLDTAMPKSSQAAQSDMPRKVIYGAAKLPGSAISMFGAGILGGEYVLKEPKQALSVLPLGLGMMAGGIVTGVKERPGETAGELASWMLIGKLGGGKVPQAKFEPIIGQASKPTILPGKAIKLEAGLSLARGFEKVDPVIKVPLEFTGIKSLPGKTGPVVESWIKTHPEQSPVIGGSAAAKVFFKEVRTPGDLDIFVKDPIKSGPELFKLVSKEMEPGTVRATPKPKWDSYLIETKTPEGVWHHALDIHTTVPKGSQFDLGFKTQAPIRVGGIKYQAPGELIQRKAASVLQPLTEGKFSPKPQRMKDVGDFPQFTQQIIAKKRAQSRDSFLKFYKERQVKGYEKSQQEYMFHSSFGPDIYTTKSVLRGYGKLPASTKIGLGITSVGLQASQFDMKQQEYTPKQRITTKKDTIGYPSPKPAIKKEPSIFSGYPATKPRKDNYPGSTPKTTRSTYPVLQQSIEYPSPTAAKDPYAPYKPAKKSTDPYYPPYNPVDNIVYSPPWDKPKKLKRYEEEVKSKRRRAAPVTKGKEPDYTLPWFPASLEMANLEEMQTGKIVQHVGPQKTSQKLFKGLILGQKPIPTKRQYESSKSTKSIKTSKTNNKQYIKL